MRDLQGFFCKLKNSLKINKKCFIILSLVRIGSINLTNYVIAKKGLRINFYNNFGCSLNLEIKNFFYYFKVTQQKIFFRFFKILKNFFFIKV